MSLSSISNGYEMSATAVQLAAGMGAIGNDGDFMEPRLIRPVGDEELPLPVLKVASPETCRQIRDILGSVVTEGTGKSAALDGWSAGGKTGMTKKIDPVEKRYTVKDYIASFCGIAPLEEPRISICVWIDTPRNSDFYGVSVAAPLFKEMAEFALNELRVPRNQ